MAFFPGSAARGRDVVPPPARSPWRPPPFDPCTDHLDDRPEREGSLRVEFLWDGCSGAFRCLVNIMVRGDENLGDFMIEVEMSRDVEAE